MATSRATATSVWGALVGLACLSGCTTIVLDPQASGADAARRDIVSLGLTRIVIPETRGETLAFKRTGLGLGFGSAVGSAAWLGFEQNEWVIADPARCQLLVVIRSDVEGANAALILEQLKGVDICHVYEAQH